jgi:putative nucleotidyltransferase with HDIG domain
MKEPEMQMQDIVERVRQIGTPQPVIDHMVQVNAVAMLLTDAAHSAGRTVERDVVQAACLMHDVGIPHLTQEFVSIPEYGPEFRVEVDHLVHVFHSTRIVKELGLPDAVVLCVLRHALGPNNDECRELGLPPSEKEALPENDTEEVVAFADYLVWMARTGNDPWVDPEASPKAAWPFLNTMYRHYTGDGIAREHPFVRRYQTLSERWLPLARMEFLPGGLRSRLAARRRPGR